MTTAIAIREETAADHRAIGEVTAAAFAALDISSHTEPYIIESLRAAGVLTLSLVAERDGEIVGHIAFSPVTVSDGTRGWYGLGPVSVRPDCQRRGIGGALIERGLQRLRAKGAKGCCLVGHPEYYGRFGFRNPTGLAVEGVPAEAFFALAFDGQFPRGTVAFHDSFMADESPAG